MDKTAEYSISHLHKIIFIITSVDKIIQNKEV